MRSICIKTTNRYEIDSLIKQYNKNYIDKTIIKTKKLKFYYNFIVHYFGEDEENFFYSLSVFLSEFIIENYEKKLIKRCINKNYFYFDEFEKDIIYKIALKILELQNLEFDYKEEILTEIIFSYIKFNKKFYMEGMVNFRIKDYIDILDYLVELSIMNYLKFV